MLAWRPPPGLSQAFVILPAPITLELSHLPVLVPTGISPCWLGGQDYASIHSFTLLPRCSPSPGPGSARTGYALFPSKALQAGIYLPSLHKASGAWLSPRAHGKGKEPGFPVGLEQGCGSQLASAGADPGWASPRAGLPNPPFPCASQLGFTAQALPEHPQPSPAHPCSAQALPQPRQTPHQTRQPYNPQKTAPGSFPHP